MTGDGEVWSDEPPGPGTRKKYRDPPADTPAGGLLARLRAQPGRWLLIASNVGGGWFFTADAKPLEELRRRSLVVRHQDPVSLWRRDIWARALTPDEIESEREIETT